MSNDILNHINHTTPIHVHEISKITNGIARSSTDLQELGHDIRK